MCRCFHCIFEKLIKKKDNGRVKVITGLRRCGKSVLLFQLYRDHLLSEGVAQEQIIGLALDVLANAKYRNPMELDKYIRDQITDSSKRYYIFIDEIQFVSKIQNPYVDDPAAKITFIDVVLGLMQIPNADIYVTGSNSNMLSSDILISTRLKSAPDIQTALPVGLRFLLLPPLPLTSFTQRMEIQRAQMISFNSFTDVSHKYVIALQSQITITHTGVKRSFPVSSITTPQKYVSSFFKSIAILPADLCFIILHLLLLTISLSPSPIARKKKR